MKHEATQDGGYPNRLESVGINVANLLGKINAAKLSPLPPGIPPEQLEIASVRRRDRGTWFYGIRPSVI